MEKEQAKDLRVESIIHEGKCSIIARLEDERIVKVAKNVIFQSCITLGISYEDKILNTSARSVKGIVTPISAIYNGKDCIGYTMKEAKGLSLNDDSRGITMRERTDLHRYFNLYKKIEELVISANKKDIVIPDLCTCDNIIFNPNGEIEFIDFDGMQLGMNDKALSLSTSLGDPMQYVRSPKYTDGFFHFTKELDKTSLTIMMFLWIFNIDLKKIGFIDPVNGKAITLKDMFDLLGIDDIEFMNKVEANLSLDKEGSFLTSDLHRIASNYNMKASNAPFKPGMYIKRLTKK